MSETLWGAKLCGEFRSSGARSEPMVTPTANGALHKADDT